MLITNLNLGNFNVDGVYTSAQTIPAASAGPATGLIAISGGGNYGPVNAPTAFADPTSLLTAFGTDTTSEFSLVRSGLSAISAGGQAFLGCRVTDGTDAPAVIGVGCGGVYATGTLTVVSLGPSGFIGATLTPAVGSPVVLASIPVAGFSNVSQAATALAAEANASLAVAGASPFLQPCAANVAGPGIISIAAYKFGAAGNSITIQGSATGGGNSVLPASPTALSGGAAAGSVNLITLTSIFTGSLGNLATALVGLQSGSPNNTPVLALTINFPGYQPETYNNIVAYTVLGGAFDATTAQNNLLAAINGLLPNVAGSPRWVAATGSGTKPPVFGNAQTATGGLDGTSGLTSSSLLGVGTIGFMTGANVFQGQISAGQLLLAGLTDPTQVANALQFAVNENATLHYSFPKGTTTTQAVATRQQYDLAAQNLEISIDWDFVFDALSGASTYVYPSAFTAGIIASVAASVSPGNQPPQGVAGVLGTERIVGGVNTVGNAERGVRQQNGIKYLGYMPRFPRGPQLGLPHGIASDGVTRTDDVRMTQLIVQLLADAEGPFVDGPISTLTANLGQPTFGNIKAAVTAQLNQMVFSAPQQIAAFGFNLSSANTPTTVGEGFLLISVQVTTLSKAQFILNLLQIGPNVVAQVSPVQGP